MPKQLLNSRYALFLGAILALFGLAAIFALLGGALVPALSVYADFLVMAALVLIVWAVYDWAVPYATWREIYEERNVAAAVFAVGVLIALALVATAT